MNYKKISTEEATILIIRQQPVASDLRKILMIMRLATEYERIADYTKNLAEYIILIKENESLNIMRKMWINLSDVRNSYSDAKTCH